jgi:hypothetical protein
LLLRDGDSKYVAEKIAGALGDEARSIQECDGHLSRPDVIGFVTPTYVWGLPEIVIWLFSALVAEQPGHAFFVVTYGTTPGSRASRRGNCWANEASPWMRSSA